MPCIVVQDTSYTFMNRIGECVGQFVSAMETWFAPTALVSVHSCSNQVDNYNFLFQFEAWEILIIKKWAKVVIKKKQESNFRIPLIHVTLTKFILTFSVYGIYGDHKEILHSRFQTS